MAKVQIKSEQITPFGGMFPIMEQFDAQILYAILVLLISDCAPCLVLVGRLRKKQDVGINSCTLKKLYASKIYQEFRVCAVNKETTCILAITSTHPLVGCDMAEVSTLFEQLLTTFIEQTKDVANACKSLVILIFANYLDSRVINGYFLSTT